jgi:hypothetical protein
VRRSVHSLLQLLALGGFAAPKTIINAFRFATTSLEVHFKNNLEAQRTSRVSEEKQLKEKRTRHNKWDIDKIKKFRK